MKMKNVAVIVVTVLVLIGATYYADKATRIPQRGSTHASYSPDKSIGKPAPDVHFKDLDGKEVSLADYNGKVVLVNFWATWCDPCRVEIPWLIEMQQKYGCQGIYGAGRGDGRRREEAWWRRLWPRNSLTSADRSRR